MEFPSGKWVLRMTVILGYKNPRNPLPDSCLPNNIRNTVSRSNINYPLYMFPFRERDGWLPLPSSRTQRADPLRMEQVKQDPVVLHVVYETGVRFQVPAIVTQQFL